MTPPSPSPSPSPSHPSTSPTTSPSSTSVTNPTSTGLTIINTDEIRSFLIKTSVENSNLPENLKQSASYLSTQTCISYQSLRSIWVNSHPSSRPSLSHLLLRSSFVFSRPQPRQKSEELKERLKKLEELAERKAYAELIKDITPKQKQEEPFSSYKDQLGFGLHVIVTMFTGYLVGYVAFRALFGRNPVMSAAGGIIGLICGMLVETLLFIIRTSDNEQSSTTPTPTSKSNLRIKKSQ